MPHDSWARQYDFIFDECFGDTFRRLTDETVRLIAEIQPASGRVLDLGSGTGRIAIPLARQGYHVTAVEGSDGMADVLAEKAAAQRVDLDIRRADMRDLAMALAGDRTSPDGANGSFDVCVAIFTVFNYLVSDEDLLAVAAGIARHLRLDGRLLFDLAERRLFASALFESERLHREIDVSELSPDVFRYRDAGCGVFEGERFQYDDLFTLRYWRPDELLWILARHGLTMTEDATEPLRASGSRWFVLEKEG
jgi:SAM-dependent methyltransferase